MTSNEQLRQQWKEANDKVRVAEERLAAAWSAFAAGQSEPPDKDLVDEVARLRMECDARLAAVIDQFGQPGPDSSERPSR